MVIAFDVNGTLLDVGALAQMFKGIFGSKYTSKEWFTELIQYSMAVTLSEGFQEFGDIAEAVLRMAAAARRAKLVRTDFQKLRKAMLTLPAFPEVPGALRRLRDANHRLIALSNSGSSSAGIDGFFERALSASAVEKYKPAPQVYRFAARTMGVRPRDLLMVAAHPWDLLGAARVGCRTALITRPGVAPLPKFLKPEVVATDLDDFASHMLKDTVFPAVWSAGS
jgi:2-haloacid dehalogenase